MGFSRRRYEGLGLRSLLNLFFLLGEGEVVLDFGLLVENGPRSRLQTKAHVNAHARSKRIKPFEEMTPPFEDQTMPVVRESYHSRK